LTRPALIVGSVLILISTLLVAFKVVVLEVPLIPSDPGGLWHVELSATLRGRGENASIRFVLPASDHAQVVYDEHSAADRLEFFSRRLDGGRVGGFQGVVDGTHRVVYGFRVKLGDTRGPPPVRTLADDERRLLLSATAAFPANAREVAEVIESLMLPSADEPDVRIRALHAFVVNEISTTVGPNSNDAIITLVQREGSAVGKAKLLVTLARAAGIPSRLVHGLLLDEGAVPVATSFVESFIDGRFVPISPVGDFFGTRPPGLVVLYEGEDALVTTSGLDAYDTRFRAERQRLNQAEVAAMMVPASTFWSSISLYRLPLAAQHSLKLLLLFPLGALVLSIMRNVVGLTTFGTFLPLLLAFALRGSGFLRGLTLIGGVIAIAIVSRIVLERLRLLIVPRLSVLLSILVLLITGLAIIGGTFGIRDFFAGLLFPIVIMTMLVERASVTLVEEGSREALRVTAYTIVIAALIYPVLTSEMLGDFVFGFPEVIFAVMGVLVLIGGYTGYRLMELTRFASLAHDVEDPRAQAGTTP
jgi:hypothetical protein